MSKITEIQQQIALFVSRSAKIYEDPQELKTQIEQSGHLEELLEDVYKYGWNNAMERVQDSIIRK